MKFKDYYKILELENNKVTTEQIKNAYRKQAKKYHPDVNVGNRVAEERIKDINEAYRVLSNNITKRKYDKMWNKKNQDVKQNQYKEEYNKNNSPFSEFFNMFFGSTQNENKTQNNKNKKEQIKGENLETNIDVDIEEVFYGLDKKIHLRTVDGKMKAFTFSIPAGIHNGERIRLIGQGKPGVNGGKNGDLIITVKLKEHLSLKLEGLDIHTNLDVTYAQAVVGDKIKLKILGEQVDVIIPASSKQQDKLNILNKGYVSADNTRGNLIIHLGIKQPEEITERERKIYEQLLRVEKQQIKEKQKSN